MPDTDPKDHRPSTLGSKIKLILERPPQQDITMSYVLGDADGAAERGLAERGQGFTIKSGEVRFASGHRFHALIQLDSDSYENWGIGVAAMEEDRLELLWQDHEDFEECLGAIVGALDADGPPLEIYPYRYYDLSDAEKDHYVDDDGWSLR